MATTEKGIYYPADYDEVADIPEDMKTMAESIDDVIQHDRDAVDEFAEQTNQDISSLKARATTSEGKIEKLETDVNTAKTDITTLQTNVATNTQDIAEIKTEQTTQNTQIANKVDKVQDKGLSTEDYTTEEKNKLAELENYDDTKLIEEVAELKAENTKLKNQIPTGHETGDNITLNDSAGLLEFKEFTVDGKSTQDGTPTIQNIVEVQNLNGNVNIKVANGTDSTAEGYEEQTVILPLPEGMEMCAVPNSAYVDSFEKREGKWYKKTLVRKLELAIADMNNSDDYPGWRNQTQLVNDYPGINLTVSHVTRALSNITTAMNRVSLNTRTTGTLFLDKAYFGLTQTQWKQNYPDLIFRLYYGLQTPDYIEITDTTLIAQLDKLEKLYSYKGTTHITSEADLDVTYRKDQDLENKNLQAQIDELKTSILSLGGNV